MAGRDVDGKEAGENEEKDQKLKIGSSEKRHVEAVREKNKRDDRRGLTRIGIKRKGMEEKETCENKSSRRAVKGKWMVG